MNVQLTLLIAAAQEQGQRDVIAVMRLVMHQVDVSNMKPQGPNAVKCIVDLAVKAYSQDPDVMELASFCLQLQCFAGNADFGIVQQVIILDLGSKLQY